MLLVASLGLLLIERKNHPWEKKKKLMLAPNSSSPNIWAVGDIQGCYEQLNSLLEHPET